MLLSQRYDYTISAVACYLPECERRYSETESVSFPSLLIQFHGLAVLITFMSSVLPPTAFFNSCTRVTRALLFFDVTARHHLARGIALSSDY